MQPPRKCSPEEFKEQIQAHVRANYLQMMRGERVHAYSCRRCWSRVLKEICYVSEHLNGFGDCCGTGRVEQVEIPYCPSCEGNPKPPDKKILRSCWHVECAPSANALVSMGIKDPEFE